MDIKRAKEIAASPEMKNVTYNGMPIYIQSVDEQNNTATIHALDRPQNEEKVAVATLREH